MGTLNGEMYRFYVRENRLDTDLYTISGSYSITTGTKIALNISPASDIIIRSVTTNGDYTILCYNQHATGTPDGVFLAYDANMKSTDVSPTQGQVQYAATPVGNIIAAGFRVIDTPIISGYELEPSFVISNDTGTTQVIRITVTFAETSDRESLFGLTPSTQLIPDTEMAIYG